jgi:hypothetical protein
LTLDTASADALTYALGDLEALPVEAPKHVRYDVGRWAIREFRAERAQAWLAERFASDEWPDAVAGELRHATWLMGRSARRPHLRVTRWAELLDWCSAEIDSLAPAWEERAELHRFDDDWTIEHVASDHDLELEGRLMRHRLDAERGKTHTTIASLRDPGGRPHVTLVVEGSEITQAPGRWCSRPKPVHAERVAEYAKAAGLGLELEEPEAPESA